MNAYEHIDAYKAGKITGEMLREFEELLAKDTELQQLVANYDDIKTISEGLLETKLLDEVSSIAGEKSYGGHRNTKFGKGEIHQIFYILAGLIVAAFLLFYLKPAGDKNDEPAIMALEEVYKEPIWPVSRTGDEDYISKAASKYLAGDLPTAKLILLDSVADQTLAQYWLAEMYLKERELDSVRIYLPQIDHMPVKKKRIEFIQSLIQR